MYKYKGKLYKLDKLNNWYLSGVKINNKWYEVMR